MCNNLLQVCLITLSLTLLGMGLSAQGLPQYGVVRLQTAPELSFGSFPQQAAILGESIIIQGVGWDSLHIFTTGSYFSKYNGSELETLTFDTSEIRSLNDAQSGSAMHNSYGLTSIRDANYDPIDTNYTFSGSASILEFIKRKDSLFSVHNIDTLWLDAEEVEVQTGYLSTGVRELLPSGSDTIKYVFSTGFISQRKGIVEVRSYIPDVDKGLIKVKTVSIVDGVVPRDFQIGTWSQGDTLGRANLVLAGNRVDMVATYFNIHTGKLLEEVMIKESVGNPRVIPSGANGLGYAYDYFIDESDPNDRKVKADVFAFDLMSGVIIWDKVYSSSIDWLVSSGPVVSRVDSAGKVLITGFPIYRLIEGETDFEYQVELRGADAATGDSLWSTIVALDSFATRDHDLVPMDIAMKPNGEGYVVATAVADRKLDPHRDLRYAYTARFFLDSLGCLAPGCRDPSSTRENRLGYEISLAPNPVRAGEIVSVKFPDQVTAVRYAITNAQGQRLGFRESENVTGGLLDVPIEDLASGMYYLTVWPAGSGSAMLTRGFVVE